MKDIRALTQIKKGALEFCVLAVIAEKERYGYEIVRLMAEQGLTTNEGTVYPILARLKKENLVTASWYQTEQGNPRKYYRITEKGIQALDSFRENWHLFVSAVNEILKGGSGCEGRNTGEYFEKLSCRD